VTGDTVIESKIAAELAKKGKNLLSASLGMIVNDPTYLASQKLPKKMELASTYYPLVFLWLRPLPYYRHTQQLKNVYSCISLNFNIYVNSNKLRTHFGYTDWKYVELFFLKITGWK
jgi:hypothetical protein